MSDPTALPQPLERRARQVAALRLAGNWRRRHSMRAHYPLHNPFDDALADSAYCLALAVLGMTLANPEIEARAAVLLQDRASRLVRTQLRMKKESR